MFAQTLCSNNPSLKSDWQHCLPSTITRDHCRLGYGLSFYIHCKTWFPETFVSIACSWKTEHNRLWVSPTFSPVIHHSTFWDQYHKWVHMPTLTIKALILLSRYLQWSVHLYCERFYACAYDAMAARVAEQWSWIDDIFCQDYGAVSWWYTMCQVTPHCLLTSRRTQASWKGTKLLTLLFFELVAWNCWQMIDHNEMEFNLRLNQVNEWSVRACTVCLAGFPRHGQ